MHQVGELYDEIIELISDPERFRIPAFNEASYDMQASWDDWGRGYKPVPQPVTPEGDLDPTSTPLPAKPRRRSDPLAAPGTPMYRSTAQQPVRRPSRPCGRWRRRARRRI